MSEWIDFSPEPIDFTERRRLNALGPLGPLIGVLGAVLVVSLAVVLG
ncbi:MAG: hypothetical protein AAF081_00470 [Actinomycetota bacterium]